MTDDLIQFRVRLTADQLEWLNSQGVPASLTVRRAIDRMREGLPHPGRDWYPTSSGALWVGDDRLQEALAAGLCRLLAGGAWVCAVGQDDAARSALLTLENAEAGTWILGLVGKGYDKELKLDGLPRVTTFLETIQRALAAGREAFARSKGKSSLASATTFDGALVVRSDGWIEVSGTSIWLGHLTLMQLAAELQGLIVRMTQASLLQRNELEKTIATTA